MSLTAKSRRRIFGALCLGAALVLLLLGNTKPKPSEPPWLFAVYWSACFLFCLAAMIAAIRDAGEVRREARRQQRSLLEKTLENIESSEKPRPKTGNKPGHSADLRD